MSTYFTQDLDVVQVEQPVSIVYEQCLVIRKVYETAHLLFEAVYIVLDRLLRHHLAHIGTTGRITDHGCTSTDQGDWFVSCHLQTLHQAQSHEMSDMKAVGSRIKSDVECCFSVVDEITDLSFVRYLRDQPAGNQFIIKCHSIFLAF